MDRDRLFPWLVRALWVVLPFVAGPTFATVLDARSTTMRTAASILLWAVWAVAFAASLVLHPVSLTIIRCVAPAAISAATWSALVAADSGAGRGLLSLAVTGAAAAVTFLPETGEVFVNGPAYPNERRYPLRVPGALLLGPLEVAWALLAGLPVAAVLLLADQRWWIGGPAAVAAVATVVVLGRSLHGLSRRWVVFVPAGLVLHDPMSLADPVLFPKAKIDTVDVAVAGTGALDLTQHSAGLALELRLLQAAPLVLAAPRGGVGMTEEATAVLFAPTRLGRVVTEAQRRLSGRPVVDTSD